MCGWTEILDRPGGHSVAAEVMLRHDGELVAVAPATASPSADAGVLELELPGRETYSVEIRPRDAAPVQRAFTTGAADETISLSLVVTPP